MATKKARAKKATPKLKATDEGKTKDGPPPLDSRPELDPETALEIIEKDLEEEQDKSPAWPETIVIKLGEDEYEYQTAPAEDVLDYIQIAFALDADPAERIRSFLQAILAPGEHDIFKTEVQAYLISARAAGEKIDAKAFWEQLGTNVFEKFTEFMTPKGGPRSTGRRRTGRRSRSRR